jgi:hypothetical protein
MLQQRKNDFAVKNVTNPVRSNVFRGSLRWGGLVSAAGRQNSYGMEPTAV